MTLTEEFTAANSPLSYEMWLEYRLNQARNKIDRLEEQNTQWLREIHKVEKEADTISHCPHCGGKIKS